MPPHIKWPIWRLVIGKVATLREIEEHYSILDVLDANELMDLQEEANRAAPEKT